MSLEIKKGDTKDWGFTLQQNGVAVDLSGAAVVLYMRDQRGTTNKIDGAPCTIVTAADGEIKYTPSAEAVDAASVWRVYFRVTFSDGTVARFPSEGFEEITIGENFE